MFAKGIWPRVFTKEQLNQGRSNVENRTHRQSIRGIYRLLMKSSGRHVLCDILLSIRQWRLEIWLSSGCQTRQAGQSLLSLSLSLSTAMKFWIWRQAASEILPSLSLAC